MKISTLEKQVWGLEKIMEMKKAELGSMSTQAASMDKAITEIVAKKALGELYSEEKDEMRKKADDILAKVKPLSDDEKLVIGQYLYSEGVLRGCGGFGSYKSPTTCGGCHNGERYVHALGLEEYVKFRGDRCYSIPDQVFDKALKTMAEKEGKDAKLELEKSKKKLEDELEGLGENKVEKAKTLGAYKHLEATGVDYELVQEKMPEFIKLIKGTGKDKASVTYATAKPEQGVGVILADEWAYYGSGGCEYGVSAIVFRDGETKSQYFKWRDPYNAGMDDRSLNFREAEIIEVTDDKVTVNLKSNEGSRTRTYELKKQLAEKAGSLEAKLDEKEQKAFMGKVETKKKELLKAHYRENAMMPTYVDLFGFQGTFYGDSSEMIPYKPSEIVDEYFEPEQGIGVVVLKAQIDHGAGRGKQFEWVAYKVTGQGADQITRDCAYELELKEGKRIDMKASELYKAMAQKK
jgi:hypothetical protein